MKGWGIPPMYPQCNVPPYVPPNVWAECTFNMYYVKISSPVLLWFLPDIWPSEFIARSPKSFPSRDSTIRNWLAVSSSSLVNHCHLIGEIFDSSLRILTSIMKAEERRESKPIYNSVYCVEYNRYIYDSTLLPTCTKLVCPPFIGWNSWCYTSHTLLQRD